MMRFVLLIAFASACTARSAYVHSPSVQQRYLITMGDTPRPYESLGYLQLTRKGADLFGFLTIVDADLGKLFGEEKNEGGKLSDEQKNEGGKLFDEKKDESGK